MLYDVKSPEDYIQALEDDWRKEKLLELQSLILTLDPSLELGINYKMLSFKRGDKAIFHLNAQKAYVSLYGYFERYDYDKTLLDGFSIGKGCVRVKKSTPLDGVGFKTFLKTQLELD